MICLKRRALAGAAGILGLCSSSIAAHADVTISNKPTQNMSCEAGVCTATAPKAVLNVADLPSMLASGDVAVKTGSIAKDIDIDQPLTWSSTSRLTLDAQQSIIVNDLVTLAGSGGLTITYADGGAGGDLQFFTKGKVNLSSPSSSLVINGQRYTLVYYVASLVNGIAKNPSGNFALAEDSDAGSESYSDSPITLFGGIFEGLGHSISHLSIHEELGAAEVGLFGELDGVVRDISLVHVKLRTGKAQRGGALAGSNVGTIIHARASVTIRANRTSITGGLVGWNRGVLVGSSADVQGAVSGGIAGVNSTIIDQCFATGETTKPGGGLVDYMRNLSSIFNSYASLQLDSGIGGLIGGGYIKVKSSYSVSHVAQTGSSGGFVGEAYSNAVRNAYWDTDTSGQAQGCGAGSCTGITGLSDAQLKSGLPPGFDPKIWAIDSKINAGYPYLRANPPQ
jgi:hypothetical protein